MSKRTVKICTSATAIGDIPFSLKPNILTWISYAVTNKGKIAYFHKNTAVLSFCSFLKDCRFQSSKQDVKTVQENFIELEPANEQEHIFTCLWSVPFWDKRCRENSELCGYPMDKLGIAAFCVKITTVVCAVS